MQRALPCNRPTQANRRGSKIWSLKFQRNRFTLPASRRPNFMKIGWFLPHDAILNLKINSYLMTRLSLDSKFAVAYHVSSKFVHVFCLQTPITAKCSMFSCQATGVAMATAWRRTCRGDDWMRPSKFRPNWSICRRVIAFPKFSDMAAVRHLEF